ncbi:MULTISPECIES: 3'-5' exonuclease [unclassified Arcicella]|uniref:3'-5' exonuclease n=1 Tax=unclassified Arcicella TaxID=2644986 RepID=UPI002854AA3F|nr:MULTISPECIES: 3'-5' exonuclease [unclassified Arcicella]MDR6564914.1 putative PolB exonuclease-like 3'-5' exonuclease [Arcicella sp. BE51]MDR6814704.1 putative PolB exonuclease-like 3'-5' exonuclease [Arcicella sp. BE140]MDR6826133.1 putative PolB exonuclease-like 3'-5' exonuclease [Arcicella sp. BE139]
MDFQKFAKSLLFIDIETVSGESNFNLLSERMKALWLHKASYLTNPNELNDEAFYFDRAGIYAEFGKIVSIGLGFFHWNDEQEICLKVKSISSDNEAEVLSEFKSLIEKKYKSNLAFCAHNGKEFDYPYLCRRMLVNNIEIPKALQISGKKPWEIPHFDTLEMWKFGDKKHYISLELLACIFDIPSSKSELSGDKVNQTYYQEKDLPKIASYCREDIIVLAQVFLKYQNMDFVKEENIERI